MQWTSYASPVIETLAPLLVFGVGIYVGYRVLRWLWSSISRNLARPYVEAALSELQRRHEHEIRRLKHQARQREKGAMAGAEAVARAAMSEMVTNTNRGQQHENVAEILRWLQQQQANAQTAAVNTYVASRSRDRREKPSGPDPILKEEKNDLPPQRLRPFKRRIGVLELKLLL